MTKSEEALLNDFKKVVAKFLLKNKVRWNKSGGLTSLDFLSAMNEAFSESAGAILQNNIDIEVYSLKKAIKR